MRIRVNEWMSLAVALAVLGLVPGTVAAGDMPEGAETCVECHGDKGVSDDSEIPTIAGASAFFLENQLFIYQEEARPCVAEVFEEAEEDPGADDHCALAADLSEDEILELADYFGSQEFSPAEQPVDEALAEKGASIHERSCDKCHAEAGSLDLDDAGILAGQWKPYLLEQLRHYKAGERWQPEKMEPPISELSEEDMKALVEYYASEGPKRFQ